MRQLDDARMKLGQAQCSSLKCRSAPAAGLLAQSAGRAGDQLNSARWSVGSSDHWVGPGSYRAGKSVPLQARQGFLLHPEHKEKKRKDRELVGFNIQPQEWCEVHKEAVLGEIKGEVMNDPLMGFDSCRHHQKHPPEPKNTRK
ncbi:hypothetical protein F2Q70_00002949 [Brassica cretica]|uniref:Uncharacterized protein n=1 Tax=Brassica cretica TaxID=69181 RepID=A0A8S9J4P8_BRACR|nr:hypothetical protein F2Q70_00002949 [Brassica cretica]